VVNIQGNLIAFKSLEDAKKYFDKETETIDGLITVNLRINLNN